MEGMGVYQRQTAVWRGGKADSRRIRSGASRTRDTTSALTLKGQCNEAKEEEAEVFQEFTRDQERVWPA